MAELKLLHVPGKGRHGGVARCCTVNALADQVGQMSSHTSMATKLLSDEATQDVSLTVVYELLKKVAGAHVQSSTQGLIFQQSRPKKENGIEAGRRHSSLLSALCPLFDFGEELEHPVKE